MPDGFQAASSALAQSARIPAAGADQAARAEHDRMANAIRALAMDAVEQAKSGHPGLPMGAADIATVLFTRFLKFDPADPAWPDRDRFVLSAGHGSMLLYALLHLVGFESMTDRGDQEFPPGRLAHARPSRIRPHAGGGNDHRPARPGSRQRRRHGDRRASPGGRVRRRDRRSHHLRARFRRRPDGGHQPGSDRACRSPEAEKAHRAVRRQRHFDRRPGIALGQRRSGETVRSPRAGPRSGSTATTRRPSRLRSRRQRNPTGRP